MPPHRLFASCLLTITAACSGVPDEATTTTSKATAPSAGAARDAIASFARMLDGEWRMTAASGTQNFRTWHRGPGGRSWRIVTDGQNGGGEPWRELEFLYWHPVRQRLCLLGLSSFAQGVAEAEVQVAGDRVQFDIDLHQLRGRRTLRSEWTFTGPDDYHVALLESAAGPGADFAPLADWDLHRTPRAQPPRSLAVDGVGEPAWRLGPLRRLRGTWTTRPAPGNGDAPPMTCTCEWLPLVDVLEVQVTVPGAAGPAAVLDAVLYHHTGRNRLRCFAVSDRGHVHEGDVRVRDDESLLLDLQDHDGARTVDCTAQIDFEAPDGVHMQLWRREADERQLVLDRRFANVPPSHR